MMCIICEWVNGASWKSLPEGRRSCVYTVDSLLLTQGISQVGRQFANRKAGGGRAAQWEE